MCDAWGGVTFSEDEVQAAIMMHVLLFPASHEAALPLVTIDVELADVDYGAPDRDGSFATYGGVDRSADTHGAVLYVQTARWLMGYR